MQTSLPHRICHIHRRVAERCNLKEEEFSRTGFNWEALCELRANPVVMVDPQKIHELHETLRLLHEAANAEWDILLDPKTRNIK